VAEVYNDQKIQHALDVVSRIEAFPGPVDTPASVQRQREVVAELLERKQEHPAAMEGPQEEARLIEALRYAVTLKDPVAFVDSKSKGDGASKGGRGGEGEESGEVYAWTMFKSVLQILRTFKAVDGTANNSTELGSLVSSLSADNELWLALVLTHPSVAELSPQELGGLLVGITCDGYKAGNAFMANRPSEKVALKLH
jgi:hypothetical protein